MKYLFCTLFILSITISSCKKEDEKIITIDPCENITCLNGGICINGECDCPEGYTGPDCGREIAPKNMTILGVTVKKFPATTPSGGGWDLFSGPDIYFEIWYNNKVFYKHPTYFEDAEQGRSYSFDPPANLKFNNPTDAYVIYLYDYDTFGSPGFMGGIEFFPYTKNQDFPLVRRLDAGGKVAFDIYVDYTF